MKMFYVFLMLPLYITPYSINIIEYTPALSDVGINNCNMHSNGEALIIRSFAQDWNIVFDVGANIGEWSSAVLSIKEIKICAFEPIVEMFNALQKQLRAFPACQLCNIGLSDSKQSIEMYTYDQPNFGGSSLYFRPTLVSLFQQSPYQVTINVDTMDNFAHEHGISEIDFVKIDVEGAEYKVLMGAQNLLRTHAIKQLQFEYGGTFEDAGLTLKTVYELLRAHNYYIYKIYEHGLIKISAWDDSLENYQYSNFFASIDEL